MLKNKHLKPVFQVFGHADAEPGLEWKSVWGKSWTFSMVMSSAKDSNWASTPFHQIAMQDLN